MSTTERSRPARVVTVAVSDHDGLDIVRIETDVGQSTCDLPIAQSCINQHAAITMYQQRRIAGTSAPEDGQSNSDGERSSIVPQPR